MTTIAPVAARAWRALLVVALLVQLLGVAPALAAPTVMPADWPISGGHFYTQAGAGAGGFAITDDGIPFWTAFRQLGGVAALGYPASQRFARDGFVYQATQAALLQWQPTTRTVVLANTFELFEQAGHDDWLLARGIPRPVRDDGSNGDFARARATRLSWLTEPALAAVYLRPGTETAIARYGLPASRPERHGPFVTQRFQRVALQLWVEAVPGMPPPGSVVPVLAGDLAKEVGIVPPLAVRAEPPPTPTAPARDPHVQGVLDSLVETTRGTPLEADVAHVLEVAKRHGTTMAFESLPPRVFGLYSPDRNHITLAEALRQEDRRALAAILYHELSHALDHHSGRLGSTPEDCFNSEFFAFQRQAAYWRLLFGPAGRLPPRSELEHSHNQVVVTMFQRPVRFVLDLMEVYGTVCL